MADRELHAPTSEVNRWFARDVGGVWSVVRVSLPHDHAGDAPAADGRGKAPTCSSACSPTRWSAHVGWTRPSACLSRGGTHAPRYGCGRRSASVADQQLVLRWTPVRNGRRRHPGEARPRLPDRRPWRVDGGAAPRERLRGAAARGRPTPPADRRPSPAAAVAHEVEHVAVPLGASVEPVAVNDPGTHGGWTRPRSMSRSPSRRRRAAMSGGRRAHRRDRTKADWLPARPARHRSRSRPRHPHRQKKPKCSPASATPTTSNATTHSTWATTPHRQDGAAYAR